jgi:hypothetical protein
METKKVVIGIVTGVLIGITVWFITQYPGGPFVKPDVKIVFFDMDRPEGDNRLNAYYMQGDRVKATITVANAGRAYAENCRIYWQSDGLGWGDASVSANDFGLAPNEKVIEKNFESFVKDKWECPSEPGLIVAKAWVECENCRSEEKTDSISAGLICGYSK